MISGRHYGANGIWKEFASPSSIPVGSLRTSSKESMTYHSYSSSSTVELLAGKIEIDGWNIHDISLDVLRTRLALVPQDGTLFLGTLRENL